MLTKAEWFPGILACVLALGFVADARAGDVKLVSDTLDNVCGVEITWGADAPNGTPVEIHSDISKNWSITKPDRLCYRRPTTPDNCDSGMTQWKTQWKCASSTNSVVEELSLQ
jgi:hypothetical protein